MTTPATLPGTFSDADFTKPDPGNGAALPRSEGRAFIGFVTGSTGQTNTLADPVKAGQELVLYLRTDGGGDRVVTVASAFDIAGNTVLTFANQGEFAAFVSVAVGTSWKWKLVASNILSGLGATLAEIALLSGLTATSTELNTVADLSVNGAVVKTKKIAITRVASTSEQDTGWDLPAKSIVLDVFLDVTTGETTGTTKTVDVGLLASESGGDADGFLDGVSVQTSGLKNGVFVTTTGSNNVYLTAAGSPNTIGALLTELLIAGNDTSNGGDGIGIRGRHLSTSVTAKSVSYTLGSNNFAELVANIVIVYVEIG